MNFFITPDGLAVSSLETHSFPFLDTEGLAFSGFTALCYHVIQCKPSPCLSNIDPTVDPLTSLSASKKHFS